MYSVMVNEFSQQHDCPRAKKSKTDDDGGAPTTVGCWERLPAVILDDIFQYLSFEDTVRASSACHNWRQSLYHPRKWQQVTFVIDPKRLDKAQYLRARAGHIAAHATVRFNSIEPACVGEFLLLLRSLAANNNLESLALEPTHNTIELPEAALAACGKGAADEEFPLFRAFADIHGRRSLSVLSLGCNEELFECLPDILALLDAPKAAKIETLALATVKEDPCNYLMQNLEPPRLAAFRRLQVLSLDYDNLGDGVLHALRDADDFRRLVVHVHGIWDKHPGTSEDAWLRLRQRHPRCLLRLSCIHSTDEVQHLHSKVLKTNMPLSHLKMLFCERMNKHVLAKLSAFRETFASLVWVDNLANADSRAFVRGGGAASADRDAADPPELIILAWVCKKLEELVVLGYKFSDVDWVGIAKLRADTLRRLEIAEADVVRLYDFSVATAISNVLDTKWAPLPNGALHPSIVDQSPAALYTDEYLMPLLLADLK